MKKLLVFLAATVLVFSVTASAKADVLRLGTLLPHTGPLKEYGPNCQNGAMLAAKQLNQAGLKVKVVNEDSETASVPAINAAKKLVEIDKVMAIVGALSSGVTIPVAESVTCPAGVLLISPASTSPLITALPSDKNRDVLFRTCPSDALQGVVAGKVAAQRYKTAAVLYVNNPYGQGLAEEFKKSFEKHGGKVLAMVPHDEKTAESYTAELKKALAGKPDVLCAFSYPQHAKIYLKEAIEFFKYKSFLFCDGTKSEEIIKSVGAKNLEGLIGTAPGSVGGESLKVFNAAYKAEYGKLPPLPFITNAYDAAAVVGLAAYAAQVKGLSLSAKTIHDQLRMVANPPGEVIRPGEFQKAFNLLKKGKDIDYEGAAGAVDFDANGDVVTPIEIWKYTQGTIKTVRLEKVQ